MHYTLSTTSLRIATSALALMVAACAPQNAPPSPHKAQSAPDTIQQLNIIDGNGEYYGVIAMTALGDAVIYNTQGEIIGNVTSVTQEIASAR